MSNLFHMGSSLADAEIARDPTVREFEQEPPTRIEHVERARAEEPIEEEGSAIPEFIGEGIEHFQAHPSVDGPIEFRRTGAATAFRATVRSASGGETQVQESGQTVEAAWRIFEARMSDAITRAAVEGRS